MRFLTQREKKAVVGGLVSCNDLEAAIFVSMALLEFEVALALAIIYNIWC